MAHYYMNELSNKQNETDDCSWLYQRIISETPASKAEAPCTM